MSHGQRPGAASPADVATRASVLRRLELDVLRRLDGSAAGDHLTPALGPGNERAGARSYEPGDDARLIDWNLSARSAGAYVRTTEAEREVDTWIVADRSASLDFGTARAEKRDVVLGAAAAFGMLTVRGHNRLGVLVAGIERPGYQPARAGRAWFMTALATLHDTPRQDRGPSDDADLAAALRRLLVAQPRRSQVVVISDFLDSQRWQPPLRALALRHQVVAVHVTDPRELELPAVGMLAVVDPETGRQRYVQTRSATLRARYAVAAAARHVGIAGQIIAAGAEYLHLSTASDWLTDTVLFATRRKGLRPTSAADRPRAGFAPTYQGAHR
ncbi:MAG TPA: DUF58 domain-containing protein [Actinomycetes bacterium]